VSTFSAVTTASTNATNVKAGPGDIAGWSVVNTSAAIRYVRLYNKATVPVPASDAALIVARIPLAAGQRSDLMLVSAHIWCSAGIGFDVTAGAADSDATVTAAGDVTLTMFFD
jgi:hypothetical protein